jgi:GMC oxidoreductase
MLFFSQVLLTQQRSPGGNVTLTSSDPMAKPRIELNYLSDDEDVRVMYQVSCTHKVLKFLPGELHQQSS